jgi:hypothetical protein
MGFINGFMVGFLVGAVVITGIIVICVKWDE